VNQRNQFLDVLRGIAVLMVAVWHYSEDLNQRSLLLSVGGCGVDLFFVLSGFLISGLLFSEFKRTGSIDVKRFWIRRGFKIYPSFYSLMVTSVVIFAIVTHHVPREMLSEITFTQNYLPHVWPHTWSLAVEEHFYFILPILLLALQHVGKPNANPFRFIPLISISISGVCLVLRVVAIKHGANWDQVGFPTHLRMDALFAGVAIGYYAHFEPESFREARRNWVLLLGLLFGLTLIVLPDVIRLTFAYVVFSFIIAWSANQPASNSKVLRLLAWIGYYSYSIYLWHVLVMLLPTWKSGWHLFPLYIIAVLGLGTGLAKLIEFPALRVRDRIMPNSPPLNRRFEKQIEVIPL
jgi:peptidoglycan/LPS O-acetylase OafA/YrhL